MAGFPSGGTWSWLPKTRQHGSFTLQPVVLEYVTERLVEALAQEILAGETARLVRVREGIADKHSEQREQRGASSFVHAATQGEEGNDGRRFRQAAILSPCDGRFLSIDRGENDI